MSGNLITVLNFFTPNFHWKQTYLTAMNTRTTESVFDRDLALLAVFWFVGRPTFMARISASQGNCISVERTVFIDFIEPKVGTPTMQIQNNEVEKSYVRTL